MSAQNVLSVGDKWYSYSGEIQGDVSVPASISMILIPNTGLRDSIVNIQPYTGLPVSTGGNNQLGLKIKLNDVTIVNTQPYHTNYIVLETFQLFIPRQSKLEVISLNTTNNNTQIRGANITGYYI